MQKGERGFLKEAWQELLNWIGTGYTNIVKLNPCLTNKDIQPYQSYCTRAHGKAVRILHLAIETHSVSS